MNSPAFDDETIDLEYTAPGHDNALSMPIALVPSALCEHTFELLSMRATIENLRAENDNLRAELQSASETIEDMRDNALERGEYID